jgi:hypothetical protein
MLRGESCSARSQLSLQRSEAANVAISLILAIKSAGGGNASDVKDCLDPRCVQQTPLVITIEGASDVRD